MKMPMKPKPRKRLKATAQRAVAAAQDDYFDEEPNMRLSRAFVVVLILHVIAVGGIFLFNQLKRGQSSSSASAGEMEDAPVRTPDNPASVVRIHYLRTGESVSDVAASYGVAVSDILSASGLESAEGVKPGTEIRIPPRSARSPVPLDVRRLVDQPRTPSADLVKASQPTVSAQRSSATSEVARSIVAAPAKASASKAQASRSVSGGQTYVVVKGDNPVSIARQHGVRYEELLKVNHIDDPRKLQIGQTLVIPAKN